MTQTIVDDALVKLFRSNFERCKIGPGERVVVLSEGDQLRDYALASVAAATALGADVEDLNIPAEDAIDPTARMANIGQNNLSKHPAAIEKCKAADIVIDHMLLLFSPEQIEMQEAGTRILLIVEPIEILQRLEPQDGLRTRVEAGARRLAKARTLRFVNPAGTDVTYELGGKSILDEYGYTDKPGRWDHWPGGFVATMPVPTNAHGLAHTVPKHHNAQARARANDQAHACRRVWPRPCPCKTSAGALARIPM